MPSIIVTGATGLIGQESVRAFAADGYTIVGIDNDMRAYFFGPEASTDWARGRLREEVPGYRHHAADIRDPEAMGRIFAEHAGEIVGVIHAAAQPSHDWAAREPLTDFTVNANGTLVLLEATRTHAPEAAFVFTSTNKVYGDTPNRLPLVERERRWELAEDHAYHAHGIDEGMSIDQTLHSVFGASKVAADVMVQEYGRYFGMKTGVFRGGCLTGPGHSGAELHGFLAYLVKCVVTGQPYRVFGYKGKQVRDNIHAEDLVNALRAFVAAPRAGEVYNMGGGRHVNCSMREAIDLSEEIVGAKLTHSYIEDNRIGDHIWWLSDTRRFEAHYPAWKRRHGLGDIITQIAEAVERRMAHPA